ncbi:MAG: cell division protein FtsQ/DivIB [Tannerella sp.]|jgi:cell division protein FtsQ|nr:cell division protein FtsQ/DivIB [Tannerella sp.]
MKRILSIALAVLLSACLVFVLFIRRESDEEALCRNLIVVVRDSVNRPFLHESEIVTLLKNARLYPVNRPVHRINTDTIEKVIAKNELVATVNAYKTSSGNVKIEITQKMPILRVFDSKGSYYVDDAGRVMPADYRYATRLPVASGKIEKSFATTGLFEFALFLQKNKFWNHQIEQIYVHSEREVELVPRAGNCRIMLGSLDDFRTKLEHLQLFYEQAIPKIGWEKYETINLKYRNQIVCTKK